MNNGHIASVTFYNNSGQNVFSPWAGIQQCGQQNKLSEDFSMKLSA
jgi:hypothetical protein